LVLLSVLKIKEWLEKPGDNISTGEVYTAYKQMCADIGADILTQRRITDLISELDMLGIVNAMVVSKGRYGRTKAISVSVPENNTTNVLLEDYRLKPLENFVPVMQSSQSQLF
jgi:cell division control protein 6